jgi:hypothetical protein
MRNRDLTFSTNSLPVACVLALTVVTSMAGCGGSGGAPVGASAQLTAAARSAPAATLNVSGQYHGTVKDGVFGIGEVSAALSQYQDAVGGVFTFTYGSLAFITSGALVLTGKTLTGSAEIGRNTGGACSATETATYSTSSHTLHGTYKAIQGCSGDSGSFAMKQQCQYVMDWIREQNAQLKPC